MTKSLLLSSLAAAGLAFALGACDEQQTSDNNSVPMQQQGAMPSDEYSTSPAMPESSEPQAMEPEMEGSDTMMPESETPATTQ